MRRIVKLGAVALVMGAMVAISAAGAAAEPVCTVTPPESGDMGRFTETCVETTTTTEERTEPATPQACEVGRSGRTGTQEGTQTNTYEVTTTATTTTVYVGQPAPGKIPVSGPTTVEETSEVLIEEGPFTPTGPCRSIPGPQ
jgi:hypothetical protein